MKSIAILFGIVLLFPIVTIDAYGILACTETNIERATRGYESVVNGLNRFVERDFGDLEKYKLTDPKAYEKGLQAAHDSYPNHIQSLVNSETQLLACDVNLDTIAQLSPLAMDVVEVPEFHEIAMMVLAGGIIGIIAISKKFGILKILNS